MSHPSIADSAMLLLEAVHPPYQPGDKSELRLISTLGTIEREFHPSSVSLAHAAARHAPWTNVYFGPALRDGTGGTAGHCTCVAALWADVDFKLWPHDADPRDGARNALRRLGLPLTAVVNTVHGFHVYLGLSEPIDVRDPSRRAAFEVVNAAFARALCGPNRTPDAVYDVARILRLPNTLNFKTNPPQRVTLDLCEPSHRYSLDAIQAYLTTHHRWAMDAARPTQRPTRDRVGVSVGEGGRPGDDYNKRGDVGAVLRRHGWVLLRERGGVEYWQRPHKHGMGTSATFNHADSGLFYVFTSDGAPFEPLGAYSAFAVYTLLEHDGDYAAAARTLAHEGYGDQTIDSGHDVRSGRVPTPRHAASGGAAVPITPPELYEEALA